MKNWLQTKSLISKRRFSLINLLFRKERKFLFFIGACFLMAGIVYPFPHIAMWLGFIFAAYSAVANDSIQTIGTFISSNSERKWWLLWLYIGIIFLITVSVSWILFDGDVSFQRLASKGFAEPPTSFHFLQISAPIFLIILTRFKMPVSTTFLLLSSFSMNSGAIQGILMKSLIGYFIAFIGAMLVWLVLEHKMKKLFVNKASNYWFVLQWLTSGSLWALWIIQDAANIAVFLPRSLNLLEFLIFSLVIFIGLGLIFYLKGDKIQSIVEEKSNVKDVRPATVIDLVYTLILVFFTLFNTVPMSTTWVFIGLLSGRELAIKITERKKLTKTFVLIANDASKAIAGLIISIAIAIASNPKLRSEILQSLGW
ncbi:hypothetical protein [Fulvivirga lutea]|uniref:Phosphate/sulfate permease n=1 Tax=Fulvivirga lutea TaxID=2810512 RepID=A0A974WJH5_9BACT|nr:hypothetical protein [Fulvivirga lutea]QSE96483.1 hypothetical protein JR347_12840 [Fulvivirga lutea]